MSRAATLGDDVPTLLVVDDSADLRGYIRDHFASRFRVLEAADGAEGIALARRHLPDVVVAIVMMPGTDGHELVRALRASPETDFLSIILLTAQSGDEQRLAGLERRRRRLYREAVRDARARRRVSQPDRARRRLRERFMAARVAEAPAIVAVPSIEGPSRRRPVPRRAIAPSWRSCRRPSRATSPTPSSA